MSDCKSLHKRVMGRVELSRAERDAIAYAIAAVREARRMAEQPNDCPHTTTLRGLLERLK